jgi:DNA-directed RNA polymerase subunit omega
MMSFPMKRGQGRERMIVSVIEPKIETLLEDVDSKYTLVILAAKRSRQINSYFSQLGEGVAEFTPPQVPMSPDQAPKALSISLQEIAEDKVGYERTSEATK